MIYLTLFIEFFKVGLFAVGGGLATIPFLMDIANRYPWLTRAELTDMIAISESTPGPVGINVATYVGFHVGGVFGAILTTFALVLPSFLIICAISYFLQKYRNSRTVEGAFYGIRPTVAALILFAVAQILQITALNITDSGFTVNWINCALIAALFGLMFLKKAKKLHPLVWIGVGAVLGIVFQL